MEDICTHPAGAYECSKRDGMLMRSREDHRTGIGREPFGRVYKIHLTRADEANIK